MVKLSFRSICNVIFEFVSRLRGAPGYSSSTPWSVYERREAEEREERERRDRDKKHREEKERRDREREEKERKAREKEREEKERREREEKEREREKRAEHEKERVSRVSEAHVPPIAAQKRETSRSPLRFQEASQPVPNNQPKPPLPHATPTVQVPNTTQPSIIPSVVATTSVITTSTAATTATTAATVPFSPAAQISSTPVAVSSTSSPIITSGSVPSLPISSAGASAPTQPVTSSSSSIISNPINTNVTHAHSVATTMAPHSSSAALTTATTTQSTRPTSSTQSVSLTNKQDHRPDSRPASRPSSGPSSRPNSRPSSRPDSSRNKNDKDDIMIVGSKEATPRAPPPGIPSSHALGGMPLHHPPGSLMPPHTLTTTASSLDRARLMAGGYPPSIWNDPFRRGLDPYRSAASEDAITAARYELLAREMNPLSIDRAREEHLLRSNPLGSLILRERYNEHHAREVFERERHYAAAVAGAASFYPPTSSNLMPPHPSHLLGPQLKSSPIGHPGHHALHPHPALGSLHPSVSHHPAHPAHPMGPGMPPPLISTRLPDKKDDHR